MSTSRPKRAIARSAARLGAVQALYQMDIASTDLADLLAEYGSRRLGEEFDSGECGEADFVFLKDVVEGVVRDQVLIDRTVQANLAAGWSLDRLDSTARAILRAGAYELMFREDVPAKVSISEYVDVAKAFFDGPEPGFVNGVLDSLAKSRARE